MVPRKTFYEISESCTSSDPTLFDFPSRLNNNSSTVSWKEGKRSHRKLEKLKERLTNALLWKPNAYRAFIMLMALVKGLKTPRVKWWRSYSSCFCRVARQTYTLEVVIEGDTYYSRDVCEPGGGGVSFCPGEWRNLHKRSELKLGCEKQDYVVLPLSQELAYSKYFTYINLFNFPKALQGWYSSSPIVNWVIEK